MNVAAASKGHSRYAAERTLRRAGPVFAALGIAASLCALAGWILRLPTLAGFGLADYPEWPSNAVALIMVGLGALAVQWGQHSVSRIMLALPILVGTLALAAYILRTTSLLDGLLIPPNSLVGIADQGRPSVSAAISLLLLSASIAIAGITPERQGLAAQTLAAAALGLNALSVCVDLLQLGIAGQTTRFPASLPAACAAGLIALALMRADHAQRPPRAALQLPAGHTFTALLLLAVIPALVLPIVEQVGQRATLSKLEIVLVVSSLYLVMGLLVWAWVETTSGRDRQALQDLVSAFNALPVALVGPDGRVRHWSEGCEALFARPAANAVGRPLATVIPGIDASRLQYAHLAAGGLSPQLRRLETEDETGSRLSLVVRAEPIETSAGRLLAIALSDTGALAEARAALERSEATLEIVLEAHDIAIFDWDAASGDLTWLASAEQRLGLGPGEVTDLATWQSLVVDEDRAAMRNAIVRAVEGRVSRVSWRYRLTDRSGKERTIEATGHLFYAADGSLAHCVAVNIDVTERERREMALVSSEAQLRAIVETVPDAMIVFDEEGQMQSLSAAAERLFDIDAATCVGKNIATLIPEPWSGEHHRFLADYLGAGDRKAIGKRRELFARRSDGTEIPVEISVGEALVGERRTYVGFIRDIGPRIEAERRLEELNSAYAHSARLNAVGELAASLAHELNQPLAASSNFLAAAEALLDRSEGKSQVTDFLAQAGDQILRAGEIIRRLRDFIAKADTEMHIVPLAAMLREAVELGLTGSRQLRVETHYDFDPAAPSFLGDRIQIEQVIVNLVRNAAQALRARPAGERFIHIATRREGSEMVRISVTDSGSGLPSSVLEHFAKPFLTTKEDEGLGLGISICRRIVDAHGGTFVAGNADGGGARFEFTLPVGQIHVEGEP